MGFELTLPMPPSANNLFPTGMHGKRFKAKSYREWETLAMARLWSQLAPSQAINGRIAVRYGFAFPDKRRNDLANREKAVSDLLVASGLIEDDSLIDEMHLYRMSIGDGVAVSVWGIA